MNIKHSLVSLGLCATLLSSCSRPYTILQVQAVVPSAGVDAIVASHTGSTTKVHYTLQRGTITACNIDKGDIISVWINPDNHITEVRGCHPPYNAK